MSDDLVKAARSSYAPPHYVDGESVRPLTHVLADRIEAQAAEIARLRAACDASEERERAIELRFWQTVDRDGLTGLPSDMWAALEQLTQDRAALATARRKGMEMPPEFLEWIKREMPSGTHIHNPEWWASRVWKAAIRAAAKEGK